MDFHDRKVELEHHVVIAEAEVVAKLVDDGLANLADDLRAGVGDAEDGTAEDRDLVGEQQHVVRAARHRDAAVETEEFGAALVSLVVHRFEVVIGRLLLDDHDDVFEELREAGRQLVECFLDELLEFLSTEIGRYQPGVMLKP